MRQSGWKGVNPVCGDEIHLDLKVADGAIAGHRLLGTWMFDQPVERIDADGTIERAPSGRGRRVTKKVRAMLIDGELPDSELGDLEALGGSLRGCRYG